MSHFSHYWGEYPKNYIALGVEANINSWHVAFDVGIDITFDKSVLFFVSLQFLCFSVSIHGEVFGKAWR